MAFKLFKNDPADPPRREVHFSDLANKAFWCNLGEEQEYAFIVRMERARLKFQVEIHPNKKTNPYHPDLEVHENGRVFDGEVKVKNSPLFFGKRYGINPQYALTMDLKDSFNYAELLREGTDLMVFIWVKWEAHEMVTEFRGRSEHYEVRPMEGIWRTWFSKLRALEQSANPPGIHWYRQSFRQPPYFEPGKVDDSEWCKNLLEFEPRLKMADGKIKNITSVGFISRDGKRYPSGHSSGSYVFDLSNEEIFERIV
jgi:hypothetical protein